MRTGRPFFDCVCVGLSTVDVIALLERMPREDEKLETEATLVDGGGPAGTAACAMSRFGLRAAVLSFIGRDLWSPFVLEGFRKFRVDARFIVQAPELGTPLSMVLVNKRNASRTILWRKGGSRRLSLPGLERKGIFRSRCLHFDGHLMELSTALARTARKRGLLTSYDCGSVKPGWERLAALSDVFIASHKFARQLGLSPARAARALRGRFGFKAAVTAGERGVYWYDEASAGVRRMGAGRGKALDTTGCGDVFHGAFLASYLRRPDFALALRFAGRVAGLKAAGLGGRASIPRPEEV